MSLPHFASAIGWDSQRSLPLVFGISFQTPLVMLFLERIHIFTVDDFRAKRKIAILVITITAAVITPGQDPFSMILLAIPMLLLYELGILMIVSGHRKPVVNTLNRTRRGLATMTPTGRGKVYLVGAGPGDPGLLTRRGEALLAAADVVVYDHLASSRLLDLAPQRAIRICAGKSIGHCMLSQDQINEVLIEHARAGFQVVRLKGGDPLVFGRGAEEAIALNEAGVAFEIVPGVTAGVGVTAYAGIPVLIERRLRRSHL